MAGTLIERSAGELIGDAFSVLLARFWKVFLIHLLFWIPGGIALALLVMTVVPGESEMHLTVEAESANPVMTLVLLSTALFLLLQPYPAAASLLALSDRYTGRQTPVLTCAATALSKFLPILVITLLRFAILLLVWFVAALIGGFFATAFGTLGTGFGFVLAPFLILLVGTFLVLAVLVSFYCSEQACMLENLGGLRAMSRSSNLVNGNRWSISGSMILLYLLGFLIIQVLGYVGGLIGSAGGISVALALAMQVLGTIFSGMLSASGSVAVYFNQRVRKESFDVDELIGLVDEIGKRGGAGRRSVRMCAHRAAEEEVAGWSHFGNGRQGT